MIGASGGIGTELVNSLGEKGVAVTGLSRTRDGLNVSDETSVAYHFGKIQEKFDWIFVATGVLAEPNGVPEKSLSQIEGQSMMHIMTTNAIGPALILKHAARLLPKERRSVFAVLTARVGSIDDNNLGGWYSYRASKAAANQIVRTAAIELGRNHKQLVLVALHPGTVATKFTANYSTHKKVAPRVAADNLLRIVDHLKPEQSGLFFDWAGKEIPW